MKKKLMKQINQKNLKKISTDSLQDNLKRFIREKKLENKRIALEEQMLGFFDQNKVKSRLFLK